MATTPLSEHFVRFLNLLAAVARSPQWKEHGLRSAAYEAIGALIRCGANDTVPSVLQVLPHLLAQLASTFQMSASDDVGRDNLQQNLCLVIHLAVLKIEGLVMNANEGTGNMLADDIMSLLLQVGFCVGDEAEMLRLLSLVRAVAASEVVTYKRPRPHPTSVPPTPPTRRSSTTKTSSASSKR